MEWVEERNWHQNTLAQGVYYIKDKVQKFIELFHNAGHIVSHKDILRIDTSLVQCTLTTMQPETVFFCVSPNLVQEEFVQYSIDNVDINDSTLD